MGVSYQKDLVKLPAGTFITHGENPKVFTLESGIYIHNFVLANGMEEDFKIELWQLLSKWFKDDEVNVDYTNARARAKHEACERLDRHLARIVEK